MGRRHVDAELKALKGETRRRAGPEAMRLYGQAVVRAEVYADGLRRRWAWVDVTQEEWARLDVLRDAVLALQKPVRAAAEGAVRAAGMLEGVAGAGEQP